MRDVEILLVEDNPADVRLMQEALRNSRTQHRLTIAHDGREALCVLRREGEHANAPRPDLVLLDLNLPRVSGFEVLEQMKGDEELARTPVVVLTTSTDEQDVVRSYEQQASCYITKPVELDDYFTMVARVDEFWLQVARLPKSEG